MAISACCEMTRAKIKRAAFLSNAESVWAEIWRVGHFHVYPDLLRGIFEKNYGNHGNGSILRKFSQKLGFS